MRTRNGKVLLVVMGVLGVLVLGFAVYGSGFPTLVKIWWGRGTESLQPDQGTQIDLIEDGLENYANTGLKKDFITVSEAEQYAEEQQAIHQRLAQTLKSMQVDIEMIQTDLQSENDSFTHGNTTWMRQELIEKLDTLLNRYELTLPGVRTQQEIANQAQIIVDELNKAAHNKLQKYQNLRLATAKELARKTKIDAQSNYVISDDSLGKIEKSINRIRASNDAKEKLVGLEFYQPLNQGPINHPTQESVLARSKKLLQ